MVFGLLACCGESFGLNPNTGAMEVNESNSFRMRSESVEVQLMDRPSEVASAENGKEWISYELCD